MPTIHIGTGELAIDSDAATLRAALALSAATRAPFRWEGFRRKGGGIRAVEAEIIRVLAAIGGMRVDGGGVGETSLELEPADQTEHRYPPMAVSPGEPMLPLLRALLLPLARAREESTLTLGGSTHAPGGETFEVVDSTFRYFLHALGIEVRLTLECAGFAPRGGGEVSVRVNRAADSWSPVTLVEREALDRIQIVSGGASLPAHVQQRQAARARSGVHISGLEPTVQLLKLRCRGSGSVVAITGQFGDVPITFASVSQRGKSAETVGEEAAAAFRGYAKQPAVVPERLVESLLPFLAFADGESQFTTPRLSPTVPPVAALVRAFTSCDVRVEGKLGRPALIRIARGGLQT